MRVLIVDDSKSIRMLVAECILTLGHEVIHMESGVDAIKYIKENSPDLIMMDVEMPGMNGFETTQKIREIKGDDWFPIIFLTTKVDDDSYTQGIRAGGDAYMEKPISPLRLQLQITAMERIYNTRQKLKQAQENLLEANRSLLHLSMFDQLTGLANRRNFDETLDREFKLAKREKKPMSVLLCDIDFFKIYNDSYGHQQGDQCLADVSLILSGACARPTDLACRYGGEEFTFILPNTDLQGATVFAEKVRAAVAALKIAHVGSKVADYVTLSVGGAVYQGQFKSGDEVTKAADDALYRAKEKGRNRVETA
ncbi:MAG: diguanylate cyclase [Methylococcaceae bacterium]|nr:diguanylate cyclase [Methylococcaceae bacterium]